MKTDIANRVKSVNWERVSEDLDGQGNAVVEHLLLAEECAAVAGLYPNGEIFRSRIVMA